MRDYLKAYKGVFDQAAIEILVASFEECWKSVQVSSAAKGTEKARLAVAKHILDRAMQGERDPRRLCDGALQYVAVATKT